MGRDLLAPLLKEFVGRYPALRIEIEALRPAGWDQEPREDADVFFKLLAPEGFPATRAAISALFGDSLLA